MKEVGSCKSKAHVGAIALSLDNDYLMSCTTNHRSTIYKIRGNFKIHHTFSAHNDLITSTKFSYGSKQVLTASLDGCLKFWDIASSKISKQMNTYSKIYDMHLSRSEQGIVTGHNDCSIRFWDAKTKLSNEFKLEDAHADPVSCVRITPDENYIVSTSKDDTIKVWDIRQQKLLHTFEHDKFKLGSNNSRLCVSPNSQYAICGTKDGGIFFLDII